MIRRARRDPTFPLCALLVVFSQPIENPRLHPSLARLFFASLFAAVAVGISLASFWSDVRPLSGAATPHLVALPFSALALFAYVFHVIRAVPFPLFLPRLNEWSAIVLLLALWSLQIGIIALAKWQLNVPSADGGLEISLLIKATAVLAIAKPGIFLVAHIMFFGPGIAALLFRLPEIIKSGCRHSAGTVASVFLLLLMLINSETRISTFGFPVLIGLLGLALRDVHLSRRQVAWYAVACVIGSKCYLPLNAFGYNVAPNVEALLEFPYQFVFMNVGPWIGWLGYWIDLGLLLVMGGVIWLGFRNGGIAPRPADHRTTAVSAG